MSTSASPANIPQVKMDKLAAKAEKERIKAEKEAAKAEKERVKAEKEAAKAEKERIKAEKLAEKEAAKAEKERVKAEKEAAKAEKERVKAEKEAAKVEKDRVKAEKVRVKAEKEAAKAEKERMKAEKQPVMDEMDDSKTNMDQTLPAKEGVLTTLSLKGGDSHNDYSQTTSHLKHDFTHSFQHIMRGFDISNHTIDKKFHKFAALIFYIRFLLINSNTHFDIHAFDFICNPVSFDFISFQDFIPYFIQSTLIQSSQYSIDCKLHIIQGNKFLIDKTNIVYDFESHEPIGEYDLKKKEVIYEKAD
jgi:hypothetical protein